MEGFTPEFETAKGLLDEGQEHNRRELGRPFIIDKVSEVMEEWGGYDFQRENLYHLHSKLFEFLTGTVVNFR